MTTTIQTKPKSFFRRIREAFRGGPQGTLIIGSAAGAITESPALTFDAYLTAYVKDPSCTAFVDFLADQIVGMGFYTTANKNYPQAEEAKGAVDEFCEQINLDGLLHVGSREVVATGNSFWEKLEPEKLVDLRILPLTSIDRIKRDSKGNVFSYVQTPQYGGQTIDSDRIIHFRWNPVNCEAFGTGVLRSLLERMAIPGGTTRISFLEMKARMEKILPEIFEKYAGPDELWVLEGIDDARLASYQNLIMNRPKAGARFVYNRQADIKTVQIDPRTRFDSYLEHVMGQVNMGGQSPVSSLMISPNYLTKASSESAMSLIDRKVISCQRFFKRILEKEIFDVVLTQVGYDPIQAQVRLNWGVPDKPEIIVADIMKAAEDNLISRDEFRSIVRELGWKLEETSSDKQS